MTKGTKLLNFEAAAEADNLCDFIDVSPTPFHAVSEMGDLLLRTREFQEISESDAWHLGPGGQYVVTRNGSTLAAFIVGSKPPWESGFRIVGAHSDSPNLRLKPVPAYGKEGYIQLAVEPYGGVLLNSWLNRDLSIAGRVTARDGAGFSSQLVMLGEDLIVSIPQLAIHLSPTVNKEGLVLNEQLHLSPLACLGDGGDATDRFYEFLGGYTGFSRVDEIVGFDLMLYDILPSSLGGFTGEFIHAPRLDNLASCHAGITALVNAVDDDPESTCVVVCYDNEEVGSMTAQGAQSPFLKDVLERITSVSAFGQHSVRNDAEQYKRAIARSFCVSADMTHAVHPNYADKHDGNHKPVIGGGPVIKTNNNQRYVSEGLGSAYFRDLCVEGAGVPCQEFVSRADLACGTTIGPITAAELGIRTIDVGNPMLSMHSIREQAGTADHISIIKVLTAFFRDTRQLGA